MFRLIFPALAAFALTIIMPQLVKADENAAPDMATLVVYRAQESFQTNNLRFDLYADNVFMGRAKAEKSLQLHAPVGRYALYTSMPGAQPSTIVLKPGAVHYVHSKLVLRGNRLLVEFVEVEKQVALAHGADSLSGAI